MAAIIRCQTPLIFWLLFKILSNFWYISLSLNKNFIISKKVKIFLFSIFSFSQYSINVLYAPNRNKYIQIKYNLGIPKINIDIINVNKKINK